jgi:hypothetical protein
MCGHAGELYCAVKNGKRAKAPGPDGIVQEFYQLCWDIIHRDFLVVINDMYMHHATEGSQKTRTTGVLAKNWDGGDDG